MYVEIAIFIELKRDNQCSPEFDICVLTLYMPVFLSGIYLYTYKIFQERLFTSIYYYLCLLYIPLPHPGFHSLTVFKLLTLYGTVCHSGLYFCDSSSLKRNFCQYVLLSVFTLCASITFSFIKLASASLSGNYLHV